jgi:cyclin C
MVLYPIWEGFEPSPGPRGGVRDKMGGSGSGGGGGGGVGSGVKEKFGSEEAEGLVRRMIEERAADLAHPENAGKGTAEEASNPMAQLAGRKRKH